MKGEYKRSVQIHNNTFHENGSHGYGVLNILGMPNVEISNENLFLSNSDAFYFNSKVVS